MGYEAVRPARGAGTAATVLIWVAAASEAVIAVQLWAAVEGDPATFAWWFSLAVHVTAGIAFVVWMSQTRLNSDVITSKHQHRFTNMWVFVGWILPFANLYIPYAVMQDIWRGSDRARPQVALRQRPQSQLITAWWICFMASNVLASVPGPDVVTWGTLSAGLGVVAAMLCGRMIRQVNDRQAAEQPLTAGA
ncbi:DUF4328 domain-containing protein [Lentzea flava]|uniref:DUF4328 domain-containing protein n=1 Tax=Lentzea flava TaxID=103732 RepID=A0ABQ2VCH9_9PSEU|nr:DUF4328 domain-containing protein [Lentzea flava]MCP2204489.1 protein of unknown function (DUF4328) [Lentzea flava]GGU78460.1 hypothetical protein GCM10010178_81880 [Lentzea flava]